MYRLRVDTTNHSANDALNHELRPPRVAELFIVDEGTHCTELRCIACDRLEYTRSAKYGREWIFTASCVHFIDAYS